MLMMLSSRLVCSIAGVVRLASVWSLGGLVAGKPADAHDDHDALLPPRQICSITGAVGFGKRLEVRGLCGRKIPALMLMMLFSRLVKSAQSLGRCVCGTEAPRIISIAPCRSSVAHRGQLLGNILPREPTTREELLSVSPKSESWTNSPQPARHAAFCITNAGTSGCHRDKWAPCGIAT